MSRKSSSTLSTSSRARRVAAQVTPWAEVRAEAGTVLSRPPTAWPGVEPTYSRLHLRPLLGEQLSIAKRPAVSPLMGLRPPTSTRESTATSLQSRPLLGMQPHPLPFWQPQKARSDVASRASRTILRSSATMPMLVRWMVIASVLTRTRSPDNVIQHLTQTVNSPMPSMHTVMSTPSMLYPVMGSRAIIL